MCPCPVQSTTFIKPTPVQQPISTVSTKARQHSRVVSISTAALRTKLFSWFASNVPLWKVRYRDLSRLHYPTSLRDIWLPSYILCTLTSQLQRNWTQGILLTYTLENINTNKTGNNCVGNTSRIVNQPDVSHYVITHDNVVKYNIELKRSFAKKPSRALD